MTPRLLPPTPPRRLLHAAALAFALVVPATACADAAPADVATPAAIRPLVGVLLTGTLANNPVDLRNPDGSNAHGNLGGRVEALAGAEFPLAPNGLALRLSLGIQTTNMTSASGSERFTRFPLEASLWYPLNSELRVGAGARYAARIRFSGAGGGTSNGLNSTPGILFLADYRLLPHLSLDLRYVYERYEQAAGSDLDGSHWGLGATAIY